MMPWILLLSVFGLVLNLAFAESLIQPDWSLGLLLGALLAHRGYWPWVLSRLSAMMWQQTPLPLLLDLPVR